MKHTARPSKSAAAAVHARLQVVESESRRRILVVGTHCGLMTHLLAPRSRSRFPEAAMAAISRFCWSRSAGRDQQIFEAATNRFRRPQSEHSGGRDQQIEAAISLFGAAIIEISEAAISDVLPGLVAGCQGVAAPSFEAAISCESLDAGWEHPIQFTPPTPALAAWWNRRSAG